MFGIKLKNKHEEVMKRLNEKIQELEEFINIDGQYRSDYEIKRAKMMIRDLHYIKTGSKR